jgi:hypothetical protein
MRSVLPTDLAMMKQDGVPQGRNQVYVDEAKSSVRGRIGNRQADYLKVMARCREVYGRLVELDSMFAGS